MAAKTDSDQTTSAGLPNTGEDPLDRAARIADAMTPMLKDAVERGAMGPVLFTEIGGRHVAIPLPFPSPEAKAAVCRAAGIALRRMGATWAVFASEAWAAPPEGTGGTAVPPSQHPQRGEALIVAAMAAGTGRARVRIHPFTRNGQGRVTWGEETLADAPGTATLHLFASFLDPGH